ncbi:hypothetical protein Pa4123_58620 [Phytohabitans aurantiacus]|uniref:Glyoxalase-like domain-containing protein n=1 Tax=Phytohabitans aurantiacus TaxID=3016789 RepID=A0ABQ5R1I7_9ACTN|nr:hypothetical protein Pa4123_58620 [Phytohabitans aurantiacus]
MASIKQFQVTFDCAEPERVARFWCEVLGYDLVPAQEPGASAACVDPTGVGPRLYFQRVPEGKRDEPRTVVGVAATAVCGPVARRPS